MIAWMLYSAVIAVVIAASARAAHTLGRLAGYRLRWIWAGALALALFLSASAGVEQLRRDNASSVLFIADAPAAISPHADATWPQIIRTDIERVGRALDAPLQVTAIALGDATSPRISECIAGAWIMMTLLIGGLFAIVARRFHLARFAWPAASIHDVAVRVAPTVGPVVIGVIRPEIVVPRWLFERDRDEQRLVIAHEQEHLRARDPMLLAFAWLAVFVAPWNPALWYMLSKLRLAIELDCDARVLERGATPQAYGSLLIDVAQHASPLSLSALSLADDSSHLYQRILALRHRAPSFARARATFAAVLAMSGILVACRTALPSQTAAAPQPGASRPPGASVVAPPQTPQAPSAAAVPVDTTTRSREPRRGAPTRPATVEPTVPGLSAEAVSKHVDSAAAVTPAPLILIDGVRSKMNDLRGLDISHVEVLKGAAAVAEYGQDGLYGVITITTKRTPPPS